MSEEFKLVGPVNVTRVDTKPGEILLVEIEIGKMPPQRVTEYVRQFQDHLKSAGVFPEDVKVLYAPMRDGKPSVRFTVIGEENSEEG